MQVASLFDKQKNPLKFLVTNSCLIVKKKILKLKLLSTLTSVRCSLTNVAYKEKLF